jgi:GH24 family phage-related lysozyme (muramidase)
MAQLKPFRDTVMKTHPVDSNLSPDKLPAGFKKFNCPKLKPDGTPKILYAANVIRDASNTALVQFNPPLTIAGIKYSELYIFAPHWEGVTAAIAQQTATASPLSPAGSSIVQRPGTHYIQCNNHDWADDESQSSLRYGAVQCGLTSCANVLGEAGFLTPDETQKIIAGSPTGKFDDGVAAVFKAIGAQSIAMEGHAAVFRHLGFKADCYRDRTIAQLKRHIERKSRVVLGTNYKGSGHFVTATGFDMQKNLVQIADPYGIRDKTSTNQWETIFQDEREARVDWYDAQTMTDLWTAADDGWCVLVEPKNAPVVLPKPIAQPPKAVPTSGPRKFKPQEFRCNSKAIAFIEHFEGCELSQYICAAGVSTIGLGSTRWHDGGPIPDGATITKEQAVKFFQRDSAEFIADIQRLVDVPLTSRQIAVLLSFAYNCGTGEEGFGGSTLLKVINNSGSNEQVREQLRRWTNGGLAGLVRRRNAEAMLWEGRDDWGKAGFD